MTTTHTIEPSSTTTDGYRCECCDGEATDMFAGRDVCERCVDALHNRADQLFEDQKAWLAARGGAGVVSRDAANRQQSIGKETYVRGTHLRISSMPEEDDAEPWFIKRRDGGPWDGKRYFFATEEKVLAFLSYFLFQREGRILIEREPRPEFDRRADDLDKRRDEEDHFHGCDDFSALGEAVD